MSGTKAHTQRESAERQAETQRIIALNDNRTALLDAVAGYMHTKYGNDSFYSNHPLVTAILQSASGNIIDLSKLADDINNYQLPTGETS